MAITVYGFRSCDMVRDARKWLDAHGVKYEFFDYRKDALDPKVIDDWFERAGWGTVFNRNSTTFKELLEQTNLIKRPVLDTGRELVFGFKAENWANALRI